MLKKSIAYIVIVNYRTSELVIQCLQSLYKQKDALNGGKVIIVDNSSQDESVSILQAYIGSMEWTAWVQVLPMPRNGGFAYGCNAGIRCVFAESKKADYVMLLNPDTLVREKAIECLIDFMGTNAHVGIAGSQLENADGGIENSAHQFHTPLGELLEGARLGVLSRIFSAYEITPPLSLEVHQCDWVSGSSMMIRGQLVEDVGLLDEKFFLYFEEVDFFYRSAKAGWQTWYVPKSKVMHIEGASTGIKSLKRRPQYWYESRRRFFVKHYGVLGLISADFLWAIGRFSFVIRRFLKLGAQGQLTDPAYLSWDILVGDLRALFSSKVWMLK